MKRLILVRHGKSSWEHDLPDHKRPLKKRAYNDAELVIKTFKQFFQKPVKFWSSPAVRAHETAKLFKKALQIEDEQFKVKQELYTFNASELLKIIKSCDSNIEKLAVFGHNPALTELVNRLGDKKIDNLPTTGLCVIDFETDDWNLIENGKTILTLLPKNLR